MRIKGSDLKQIIREEIRSRLLREQDEQAPAMNFDDEGELIIMPRKGQTISDFETEKLIMQGPDAFDNFLNAIPDDAERARVEFQLREKVKTLNISGGLIKAITDYIVMGPDTRVGSEGGLTARDAWIKRLDMLNR